MSYFIASVAILAYNKIAHYIWGCLGFDRDMYDLSCSRRHTLHVQTITGNRTNYSFA